MVDREKIKLIGDILTDFWGARSEVTADETSTLLDVIATIVNFGGADNDE